jgi:hypothetical protein
MNSRGLKGAVVLLCVPGLLVEPEFFPLDDGVDLLPRRAERGADDDRPVALIGEHGAT